jgi:hypothetical protein
MVNGSQAVSSVGGGAPLFVRASSAAAVLSAESTGTADVAASLPVDQVVSETLQSFRYNSFEFSYRQDFGKIVLLRQKPDTGEVVQQFPSEYYLRKYADSERVAKTAAGSGASATTTTDVTSKADVPTTPQPSNGGGNAPAPAPVVAAAPSLPSAPALPSGGASASRVDLTI